MPFTVPWKQLNTEKRKNDEKNGKNDEIYMT